MICFRKNVLPLCFILLFPLLTSACSSTPGHYFLREDQNALLVELGDVFDPEAFVPFPAPIIGYASGLSEGWMWSLSASFPFRNSKWGVDFLFYFNASVSYRFLSLESEHFQAMASLSLPTVFSEEIHCYPTFSFVPRFRSEKAGLFLPVELTTSLLSSGLFYPDRSSAFALNIGLGGDVALSERFVLGLEFSRKFITFDSQNSPVWGFSLNSMTFLSNP